MEFYEHSNVMVLKPGGNCGKQSGAGSTWGSFRLGTIPLLPPIIIRQLPKTYLSS